MAWWQLRPHAQPALHARRAAGRAGRRLPRRRVLAGPAEGDRRPDQRAPGAPGDPPFRHLPRLDARARRALPAAAVGRAARGAHQRLLHGRRQGAGQCLLPQRREAGRADPLRGAGRPHRDRERPLRRRIREGRAHRSQDLRAGRRRLRVQPRLAARSLGSQRARRMAGRQLPDPRHALQPGRAAQAPARRPRRRPHRRPDTGAHGGHRRARAAVRRRHLHAHRLRQPGRGGESRGRALLRRGRGLLAQALRHLGPPGGAAAGADRLVDHRRQGHRPLHAAGVPRRGGRQPARAGAQAGAG